MPLLKCERLSVKLSSGSRFGTREILSDINFSLSDGDRLALVGPNGAGKSTLLRVLAQILHPSSGSFEAEGRISALFNIQLGVQRQSTGRKNMILRNLVEGYSYKAIMEKLPEMVEFADIGEYIDQPMEIYSSGMAVRTVFAAATAFDPEILLLDEWIGAGDVAFRRKGEQRMAELAKNSGIIVLATHRKKLSREVCNKGLYLRDGKVAFLGPVDEVWERYEADGGVKQKKFVLRDERTS